MATAAPRQLMVVNRPSSSSFPIEAGLRRRPSLYHGRAPLCGRPSDGERGQAEGETGSSSTRGHGEALPRCYFSEKVRTFPSYLTSLMFRLIRLVRFWFDLC
jgi:hypothetical protein